jgi:hypothetical protein
LRCPISDCLAQPKQHSAKNKENVSCGQIDENIYDRLHSRRSGRRQADFRGVNKRGHANGMPAAGLPPEAKLNAQDNQQEKS